MTTLLTRPFAMYVPGLKQQAGNIHVCKNEINKFKKYKYLRRPTYLIYIYIYICVCVWVYVCVCVYAHAPLFVYLRLTWWKIGEINLDSFSLYLDRNKPYLKYKLMLYSPMYVYSTNCIFLQRWLWISFFV